MIVSLLLVLAIELCRSYSKFRFVCLGVLLPALVLVGGFELRNGVDMEQLSVITENRTDLWKVAWAKFTERPLTGYGADSWGDDLIPRLPGLYQVTAVVVTNHAGGYHNAYFTLLAEEGILIFAFAVFVMVSAFRTVNHVSGNTRQDRQHRAMLLFALIFLVLRGFIEVPGWFGYGEDPAEFSCYALLALIISVGCEAQVAGKSAVMLSTTPPPRLSQAWLAQ
jgi:O-antigen ligase